MRFRAETPTADLGETKTDRDLGESKTDRESRRNPTRIKNVTSDLSGNAVRVINFITLTLKAS